MNVVFRVDASTEIGTGHFMRCLALAEKLRREKNAKIMFISRDLQGNLAHVAEKRGVMVYHLPFAQPDGINDEYARWLAVPQEIDAQESLECIKEMKFKPDWLVIDNYAIDATWEQKIRPSVKNIFVIDDLANRPHDCDGLLDQRPDSNLKEYYSRLVPTYCKCFFGPSYALFREEFFQAQQTNKSAFKINNPTTALVSFGGSDPTNETEKVLLALAAIRQPAISVHVVVGEANPRKEVIRELCEKDDRFLYYCQIDYMAKLLQAVDFVIGAPGTSLWEWCFLQIPSLVIAVAENQRQCIDYRTNPDLCVYLGETENVSQIKIKKILEEVFSGKRKLNHVNKAYNRYFPHGSRMEDIVDFMSREAKDYVLGKRN